MKEVLIPSHHAMNQFAVNSPLRDHVFIRMFFGTAYCDMAAGNPEGNHAGNQQIVHRIYVHHTAFRSKRSVNNLHVVVIHQCLNCSKSIAIL